MTSVIGTGDRGASSAWGEAADIAYDSILGVILRGEVEAGGRLLEKNLADLAGVSRTPVRQALNRLAAEGMVDLSRNKGAHVVSFTEEDARSLLELRARFEPYAVRLAVARLDEEDLDRIAALADQMEKLVQGDFRPVELGSLNNAFHGIFIKQCGDRHLSAAIQSLVMPAMVARTFGRYTPASLRRSMQHHAELVAASRAKDGAWAESVMRTHILAAHHAYDHANDDGNG